MAKVQFALVLLVVAFAVLACDAQKQKARPVSRKLARQEAEVPVTPYPTADELKPVVPFEETIPSDGPTFVDEIAPEASDPVPDEVFVAPEVAVVYTAVDEVYGPPEIDASSVSPDVYLARQKAQKAQKARLVQARRQAAYRKAAKLRAAKKTTA